MIHSHILLSLVFSVSCSSASCIGPNSSEHTLEPSSKNGPSHILLSDSAETLRAILRMLHPLMYFSAILGASGSRSSLSSSKTVNGCCSESLVGSGEGDRPRDDDRVLPSTACLFRLRVFLCALEVSPG